MIRLRVKAVFGYGYQVGSAPANLSIMFAAFLKAILALSKSPDSPASSNQPYTSVDERADIGVSSPPRIFLESSSTVGTGSSILFVPAIPVLIPNFSYCSRAARKSL